MLVCRVKKDREHRVAVLHHHERHRYIVDAHWGIVLGDAQFEDWPDGRRGGTIATRKLRPVNVDEDVGPLFCRTCIARRRLDECAVDSKRAGPRSSRETGSSHHRWCDNLLAPPTTAILLKRVIRGGERCNHSRNETVAVGSLNVSSCFHLSCCP